MTGDRAISCHNGVSGLAYAQSDQCLNFSRVILGFVYAIRYHLSW